MIEVREGANDTDTHLPFPSSFVSNDPVPDTSARVQSGDDIGLLIK